MVHLMTALRVLLISLVLSLGGGSDEFVHAKNHHTLNVRYIYVDVTHPQWPGLRTQMEAIHEIVRPGNVMPVNFSDSGTKAYVKVIGINSPARLDMLVNNPAVLLIHEDNDWIFEMWRTDSDWAIFKAEHR